MNKSKLKSAGKKTLIFLFFCLPFSQMAAKAENQSWLNNSLRISLKPNLILILSDEFRNQEFTFMNHYLANVQGGLEFGISENTYLAFLYKRENTKKTDFLLNENRYTLETGWKTKLGPGVIIDLRFRTEGRAYEQKKADDHFRFRLRLRLTARMKLGDFTIKPFVATEPFGDTLTKSIHQNRFSIGAAFPLGQHSTFVLNYLRQDTKAKETIHILNAGFQLKF